MKKGILPPIIILLMSLALCAEERQLVLNLDSRPEQSLSEWVFDNAVLLRGYRGGMDGAIKSAAYEADAQTDLLLHFDFPEEEAIGYYQLEKRGERGLGPGPSFGPGPSLGPGRFGMGSASFSGSNSSIKLRPGKRSILGPEGEFRDFSIEFWINPSLARDGERVFQWKASRWVKKTLIDQGIACSISKGKPSWDIVNLFQGLDGSALTLRLSSRSYLVPKRWSHHLLRFDSSSGLVEYLVDGQIEATAYATDTGHEDGSIYFPRTGNPGELSLGSDYHGLIDELRISPSFVEDPRLVLYLAKGARIESPIIDLLHRGTALISVDVVASVNSSQGMEYLIRSGDSYAHWDQNSPPWQPFSPALKLPAESHGRYVQIACNLYPDGPGMTSPQLSQIKLVYIPALPPPPPAKLSALARDTEVRISWTMAPDRELRGYKLYYGGAKGEYSGSEALQGPSPIDIGLVNSFSLTGLQNGKLYYFAISAYGPGAADQESEFSPEAQARPQRIAP